MNSRIWDPRGKYQAGFLKEYNHWMIEISFRQHTLGCFIIFAKRPIQKISELESNELLELKQVMREIETTISSNDVFRPDRYNYLQMGNGLHHLHFHGIPRYVSPRIFLGRTWIDTTYGSTPVWSKEEVEDGFVIKLKNLFKDSLLDPRP
jgi:diadenosine tetraphosphate (Ap4A) HIT family hydrolase